MDLVVDAKEILCLTVYRALYDAGQPCTRVELERLTGLDRWAVRNGLKGLAQRGVLLNLPAGEGIRAYHLRHDAEPPQDMRGRAAKSSHTRERIRARMLGYWSRVSMLK